MLEQLYPNIYKNEIPLPNNPLKSINCYIIVSEERNLIIDTGFNQPECAQQFLQGITELNLDMSRTDVVLTHLHSDHIGLASLAQKMGARILAGEKEALVGAVFSEEYWRFFYKLMKMYGLEKYGLTAQDHPGYRLRPDAFIESEPLRENDQITVGEYVFSVVNIPGHTLGHIGLYEKTHKLFFCGDHILSKITPNIICWGLEQDALALYKDSLKKLYDFEIRMLLPGHRHLITDHRARINELVTHHDYRLNEVAAIISCSPKSPCETAAEMRWDLKVDRWENFPKAQKWFSAGEAMSHLEHLYCTGRAKRTERDGVFYYELK
jgi:glyoxylase-like metal-dependent hydrolase (beta-lactamase superfamily II)